MSGINSVKNYKYSILVKKVGVLKRLKKRRKKVCWHRQLYILLMYTLIIIKIFLLFFFTVYTNEQK